MTDLYHYTCDHGALAIERDSLVKPVVLWNPGVLALMPEQLREACYMAWFSDLVPPDRAALGLSSNYFGCDRTAHRFRVLDTSSLVPWSRHRRTVNAAVRNGLENTTPGVMPMHWWVATGPVPVVFDLAAM